MKKYLERLDVLLLIEIARVVILGIVVAVLIIAVSDAVKHDESTETVQATTRVVENPVENVNNSISADEILSEIEEETPYYTDEELEILAIIIYQEAGGDRYTNDIRRMVGSVFLNRVNSYLFPNTFEEVATQRKQYGTLYLTGIKWPDRANSIDEIHAVKRAYAIADELLISGSILPDDVIYQAEFEQGSGVYDHLEDIYFCFQ